MANNYRDERYHNRILVGKVSKGWLYSHLEKALAATYGTVVETGENAAYQLGHLFGYQDALKAVIDLVSEITEDDPNRKPTGRACGQNVY